MRTLDRYTNISERGDFQYQNRPVTSTGNKYYRSGRGRGRNNNEKFRKAITVDSLQSRRRSRDGITGMGFVVGVGVCGGGSGEKKMKNNGTTDGRKAVRESVGWGRTAEGERKKG